MATKLQQFDIDTNASLLERTGAIPRPLGEVIHCTVCVFRSFSKLPAKPGV
jgi:hypothetical protein